MHTFHLDKTLQNKNIATLEPVAYLEVWAREGKLYLRGPFGHPRRATSQYSEKNFRKDSKPGCRGCLFYTTEKK